MMQCVSLLSTEPRTGAAFEELASRAAGAFGGEPADLAVVFASSHHVEELGNVGKGLRSRGLARHVIGCTGEAIVGEDREVEGSPALSLWLAQIPGVEIEPRRIVYGENGLEGLPLAASPANESTRALIVLGDPFTFPAEELLKKLGQTTPGLKIVGGMASASRTEGGNRLILDDSCFSDGGVGVSIAGPLVLRTVLSQGCRPIGRPLIVTSAERNIIRELGRRPALEVLRELFDELTPDDQERVQEGLHLGRVISEYQETFGRGDFLVRNVLGADDQGGIVVTDLLRVGQTVQFHVRDGETADEDLRTMLENARLDRPTAQVRGALLFSCNGRGTRLFGTPNHDVAAVHSLMGPVAVGGFFAMGEIGPVGGQNFLHGFTASIVLFEEPEG